MANTIHKIEEEIMRPIPNNSQISLWEKIGENVKMDTWERYIEFQGLENQEIDLAVSKDTSLKIYQICQENGLNNEQIKKIAKAAGLIIIKKISLERLPFILEKELGFNINQAKNIVRQINESIFHQTTGQIFSLEEEQPESELKTKKETITSSPQFSPSYKQLEEREAATSPSVNIPTPPTNRFVSPPSSLPVATAAKEQFSKPATSPRASFTPNQETTAKDSFANMYPYRQSANTEDSGNSEETSPKIKGNMVDLRNN